MSEIQYDTASASTSYSGPALVDERYAEVRGAVERLTNQIASAEVALHDLGVKVSPVARMDDPQPGKTDKSPNSGVELADTIEALAERVQAADSYIRNLASRIAL